MECASPDRSAAKWMFNFISRLRPNVKRINKGTEDEAPSAMFIFLSRTIMERCAANFPSHATLESSAIVPRARSEFHFNYLPLEAPFLWLAFSRPSSASLAHFRGYIGRGA